MKTIKNYNIYIFISTFTRNIIDVYSVVYLYKLSFTVSEIVSIYAFVYFLGYFFSYLSIIIGNKIGYKYILMISSVTTSISFYVINNFHNMYLIAVFLSLSMFTYHPIRHFYGINILKHRNEIGNNLIFIYIANLLSSYFAITKIKINYLILLSIISIIPALFIENDLLKKIEYPNNISKNKLRFFFFDQFRIIFILLEPLFLYIIADDISYVGVFNIILTVSSIVFIYLLANKVNVHKKYKYINILFVIILIIKLNLHNKDLLLIIAFFEGIGIKANELVSTINLYDNKIKTNGYIITCERMFCMTRALILSVIYFLQINLKIILYIMLIGIFFLSFQYKKDTND